MRKPLTSAVLIAAAVLPASAPCRAWGPVGHMAAAMIAESRLSPQTAGAVRDLIGDLTLDRIANCADGYAYGRDDRGMPLGQCAGLFTIPGAAAEAAQSRPWHFIDVDVDKDVDESSLMSACPKEGCVVAQIRKEAAILADSRAAKEDRQVALAFLVHFVGDVHQPLHCAENEHDQGGNKKPVDVEYFNAASGKTRPLNLHSAWDHAIQAPGDVSFGEDEAKLKAAARSLADKLLADLASADTSAWTKGDVALTAALESWRIAKDKIYPRYKIDGGRVADASRKDYSPSYRGEMQPVAFERIEMAGVRLAALLEQSLGNPSETDPTKKPAQN